MSLHAHNEADGHLKTYVKNKIYMEKSTAGTSSGYEQAQGHEL
jgi:hypothetical protein